MRPHLHDRHKGLILQPLIPGPTDRPLPCALLSARAAPVTRQTTPAIWTAFTESWLQGLRTNMQLLAPCPMASPSGPSSTTPGGSSGGPGGGRLGGSSSGRRRARQGRYTLLPWLHQAPSGVCVGRLSTLLIPGAFVEVLHSVCPMLKSASRPHQLRQWQVVVICIQPIGTR